MHGTHEKAAPSRWWSRLPGPLGHRWRGSGKGTGEAKETFSSRSRALAIKADVEEAGHQWPTNSDGLRWQKGLGYVASVVEGNRGPSTFHDVAVSYFEYQTRMIEARAPHALHAAPLPTLLRAAPVHQLRTHAVQRYSAAGRSRADPCGGRNSGCWRQAPQVSVRGPAPCRRTRGHPC